MQTGRFVLIFVASFRKLELYRLLSRYNTIQIKFIYSEKATKFCEIFPLLLNAVHTVKSKGKILQNFVAFSEYMNFKSLELHKNSACHLFDQRCTKMKNVSGNRHRGTCKYALIISLSLFFQQVFFLVYLNVLTGM